VCILHAQIKKLLNMKKLFYYRVYTIQCFSHVIKVLLLFCKKIG